MRSAGKEQRMKSLSVILHPLSFRSGGKGGIRTHGTLLRYTAFPVLPVQPLLHLSIAVVVRSSLLVSVTSAICVACVMGGIVCHFRGGGRCGRRHRFVICKPGI